MGMGGRAEEDLRRAVELDPTHSRSLYQACLAPGLSGANSGSDRIYAPRDRSRSTRQCELETTVGIVCNQWRRFRGANGNPDRALEIEPNDPYSQESLVVIELFEGHYDAASQISHKIELESTQEQNIAMADHALGHEAVADAALHSLIVKHATSDAYQIAQVYAWRNERAPALDWLERAYRQRDGGIEGNGKTDPLLSNVRTEPRYRALLQKMHFPL